MKRHNLARATVVPFPGGDDRRRLHGRVGAARTQWHPARAGDSAHGHRSAERRALVQDPTQTQLPPTAEDRHPFR